MMAKMLKHVAYNNKQPYKYAVQPTNAQSQFVISYILLDSCTYVMLQHVSTSVRHHQGAHLFLAKITCMTSAVIDYNLIRYLLSYKIFIVL